jgi:RNA polymerase sigma-70 factor (ECF subfamily)
MRISTIVHSIYNHSGIGDGLIMLDAVLKLGKSSPIGQPHGAAAGTSAVPGAGMAILPAPRAANPAATPAVSPVMAMEAELIRRILAGESELYYDLIAPYQRPVYLMACTYLRNEADAEECAQDAILRAFRCLSQFRGESRFGSWLIRIALNQAKMTLRKLRPAMYESLDHRTDTDNDYTPEQHFADWREIPSEALERKEIREMLAEATRSLPEIYRDVFMLRDFHGNDTATTAQILGVSEGVVKIRLLRARLQIRELLAPYLKNSAIFSRSAFHKGKNPWR